MTDVSDICDIYLITYFSVFLWHSLWTNNNCAIDQFSWSPLNRSPLLTVVSVWSGYIYTCIENFNLEFVNLWYKHFALLSRILHKSAVLIMYTCMCILSCNPVYPVYDWKPSIFLYVYLNSRNVWDSHSFVICYTAIFTDKREFFNQAGFYSLNLSEACVYFILTWLFNALDMDIARARPAVFRKMFQIVFFQLFILPIFHR